MHRCNVFIALLVFYIFLCSTFMSNVAGNPYIDPAFTDDDISYPGNYVDDILPQPNTAEKRACVKRGGNCDHRPNACCHNSSCRCNLWGSNCRCQRMGLFQKWG